MRGAGNRGIGALVAAAAVAASCGWPEYVFDPPNDGGALGGEESGGADTGGASGTAGQTGGRGGSSPTGGTGGSSMPATCSNHVLDPPETDVDCGGGVCPGCPPGDRCTLPIDCADPHCTSHGVCELQSCANGTTDGTETDKDCGGNDCEARCLAGDGCRTGSDCESAICENAECVAGPCDPEMGPCGTSDCHCANGRQCTTHSDCASGNCAGGTCAEGSRVFSRNDALDAQTPASAAILQTFLLDNAAPSDLPLGELAIRYYFTSDAVTDQRPRCDDTRAPASDTCIGVSASLFEAQSTYADTYVEVRLADGTLRAGGQTGEIPIAVEPKDGGRYDQRDDYSFSPSTTLAINTKVTLYRRGTLIWGTPPPP